MRGLCEPISQGTTAQIPFQATFEGLRTTERRLNTAKTICTATAVFEVIAAALLIFLRDGLPDTSNASYRLLKNSLAKLNDYEQALTLLEKEFATNKFGVLDSLWWSDGFDSLHDNPRFIAVLKKTGVQK